LIAAGVSGRGAGRPLRFLLAVIGGWTAFRVLALWPAIDSVPALVRALAPPVAAAELPAAIARARPPASAPPGPPPRIVVPPPPPLMAPGPAAPAPQAAPTPAVAPFPRSQPSTPPTLPPPLPPSSARAPSRWSGSAWAIGRLSGAAGEVLGGSQLGGSQAGARLAYALGEGRRTALFARVATPLEGPGREVGLGVEFRLMPGLRVLAERRVALDGGRGGPSASLVGGVGPLPVAGLRLEAYGQAGAVRRGRTEPFADGAARLARPLGGGVDLGVGAWGGAQRGAARLDLGPSVGVRLPVAGRAVRVTLDWRQRVAGNARPGSGPALSAGLDF